MDSWDTVRLVADDKRYLWHPFTPMAEWCAPEHEPVVLVGGEGAIVWDSRGREYIDGNASIWTNVHGHNHPKINAAIREQLERVAHTSFLGTTSPPAINLARTIVNFFPAEKFGRVFYSDDGSTAMEAALRIVSQYWKLKGADRPVWVSFRDAYHGDTAGAASLGAAAMFEGEMAGFRSSVLRLDRIEDLAAIPDPGKIAGVVIEPIIQGAAGMKMWPQGTLSRVRQWCDETGAILIADEVMTGFGRTGKLFACQHEDVQPDIYIFAKGLTGGYLPLALTLLSDVLFEPYLRGGKESTLFYGHSYTGNALGCAAALASLHIFEEEGTIQGLDPKIEALAAGIQDFAGLEGVSDVRSCGMIGAIDLLGDGQQAKAVCQAAKERGLLTRHIRNTVTLVLPLITSVTQIDKTLTILRQSLKLVITSKSQRSYDATARS